MSIDFPIAIGVPLKFNYEFFHTLGPLPVNDQRHVFQAGKYASLLERVDASM